LNLIETPLGILWNWRIQAPTLNEKRIVDCPTHRRLVGQNHYYLRPRPPSPLNQQNADHPLTRQQRQQHGMAQRKLGAVRGSHHHKSEGVNVGCRLPDHSPIYYSSAPSSQAPFVPHLIRSSISISKPQHRQSLNTRTLLAQSLRSVCSINLHKPSTIPSSYHSTPSSTVTLTGIRQESELNSASPNLPI